MRDKRGEGRGEAESRFVRSLHLREERPLSTLALMKSCQQRRFASPSHECRSAKYLDRYSGVERCEGAN